MKRKIYAGVFLLLITAPLLNAQFNPDSLRERVNRIVKQYVDTNKASMVVGIIRKEGNKVLNRKYTYGHLRKDTTSPRTDSLTVYHIGSVTKTFTATLLSMLIQQGGSLRLSDLADTHLPLATVRAPFYVSGSDTMRITILDLATHYSALPDDPIQPVNDSTTYQMMYNYLNNHRLLRAPGECFLYSNLGVALLGVAVSHTYGAIIDSLFIQKISRPLGMPDTRISINAEQESRRATPYSVNGDPLGFFKSSWPAFYAAGGLYSTLSDFLKYLEFNMGLTQAYPQSVLDSAHKIRRMNNDTCRQMNSKNRVGLVWQMTLLNPQTDSNFYYTWKDGGVPGTESFICFTEDEQKNLKTGVVMIANQSIPNGKLAVEILRYLNESSSSGITPVGNSAPEKFALYGGYPNPFNPSTRIKFEVPVAANVSLKIFDINGKLVSTLADGKLSAGEYEAEWNAGNSSSGVYFCRLESGETVISSKLVLIR